DTTEEAAELTLRELVLRMRCEAGIPHTRDLRMRSEMRRDPQCTLALSPHSQLERAHSADAEPCFVRWQVRDVEDRAIAHRLRDVGAARHAAAHDVAVAVHVLGERVADHLR